MRWSHPQLRSCNLPSVEVSQCKCMWGKKKDPFKNAFFCLVFYGQVEQSTSEDEPQRRHLERQFLTSLTLRQRYQESAMIISRLFIKKVARPTSPSRNLKRIEVRKIERFKFPVREVIVMLVILIYR